MAVKRGGLGRGLDGMFPNYAGRGKGTSENNVPEKKTEKNVSSAADTKLKKEKVTVSKAKAQERTKGSEKKIANENQEMEKNAADDNLVNAVVELADTDQQNIINTTEIVSDNTERTEGIDHFTKYKTDENGTVIIRISEVEPNREQPRKTFDEGGLEELAESIKQHGIIQPLIVQKRDDYFEIIAGERRWRAARLAGLKEVPVVIKDYTEKEILEVSLIENIQREDLNPVEEARAYQRLLTEFSLKQEEVAERVSKNRSTITNALRLLKLDERVQQLLIEDTITAGHARAILAIEDHETQYKLALQVIDNNMSVRDTERMVKKIMHPEDHKTEKYVISESLAAVYADMEEKLKVSLGTKVVLNHKTEQKGKIEIEYYSNDELERLFELLRK